MFASVAVVGHGLIGASIALAVRERMPQVALTIVDRGNDVTAAADCDLLMLSAPVLANLQLLEQVRPVLTSRTLVTDTGSTKGSTVAAAAGLRFIGGHPIAGAAASGRAAARADLFAGKQWILTPVGDSAGDDLEALASFVRALGATPVTMPAADHDRLFAYVSHLPQLVVSAMMDVIGRAAGGEGLALAGSGLRDSTRLANSPAEIWRDIAATNRQNIGAAIDDLIAALEALRDDGSGASLGRTFRESARWKHVLDGHTRP